MPAIDRSLDAVWLVYTCRRLIDLSLVTGTSSWTLIGKTAGEIHSHSHTKNSGISTEKNVGIAFQMMYL